MQDSSKYESEIKLILANLKVSLHQLKPNQENQSTLDSISELNDQISVSSGVYGINTLMNLAETAKNLISSLRTGSNKLNEKIIEELFSLEATYTELITDPLLKNPATKEKYSKIEKSLEKLFGKRKATHTDLSESSMANARFQEVFIEEAYDLINQLEEKMLQLESDINDEQLVDSVFRIMHTLKGNSNMFGFLYLGEVTHHLENIYDAIRGKKLTLTRPILEITLQCIDHFRNLIEDVNLTMPANQSHQSAILSEINQLLKGNDTLTSQTENNNTTIKDADSGHLQTYYLYFKPDINVASDGTNPLYFVNDLHELGNCFTIPVLSSIPINNSFIPELCYTRWHILLATQGNEEDIHEHFMFLKENSQPQIKLLSASNLITNNAFIDYFREEAKKDIFLNYLDPDIFAAQIKAERLTKVEDTSKNANDSISSVRVASTKIDKMMNLISELVTKQAELSILATSQFDQRLIEVAENIESISRDLRDNAFSISLIPLEKSVLRFQRLVRDVASRFNKKIDFIVQGKETELDKTIIEKIIDPIMHILRNSIDHGIEMPEDRLKSGKSETGTIKLNAYPSGAYVVIEISDDGAGINLGKVRTTAIRKGYINQNDNLSKDDLLDLIISPGFSTSENISEVSGRGVGMDVVNQKITEIRGVFEIQTVEGKGTTISIKLPLTISIIDSLLTKISGAYYLIPLGVVDRCAEVNSKDIEGRDNQYIVLNQEYIPFVDLRTEFKLLEKRPKLQHVVLIKYKDTQVGIIVDEVVGNYQAVLKSLGDAYRSQEIISGASILGSGEVALVLDTNRILQEFVTAKEQKSAVII